MERVTKHREPMILTVGGLQHAVQLAYSPGRGPVAIIAGIEWIERMRENEKMLNRGDSDYEELSYSSGQMQFAGVPVFHDADRYRRIEIIVGRVKRIV